MLFRARLETATHRATYDAREGSRRPFAAATPTIASTAPATQVAMPMTKLGSYEPKASNKNPYTATPTDPMSDVPTLTYEKMEL